jgi:hypothetical protein
MPPFLLKRTSNICNPTPPLLLFSAVINVIVSWTIELNNFTTPNWTIEGLPLSNANSLSLTINGNRDELGNHVWNGVLNATIFLWGTQFLLGFFIIFIMVMLDVTTYAWYEFSGDQADPLQVLFDYSTPSDIIYFNGNISYPIFII